MTFRTLTANVVNNFPEDMGEKTVVPFARGWVQGSVESVFMHRLRINDVRNTFGPIQTLEGSQKHLPCIGLACTRRTNHHQTVLDLLDLIELENFGNPSLSGDEPPLLADLNNFLAEGLQINRQVVDAWEYIRKKAESSLAALCLREEQRTWSKEGCRQQQAWGQWFP